jgi:hypothetical protein
MTDRGEFASSLSISQQKIFGDNRIAPDYKKAVIHFVNKEAEIAWDNPKRYGVRPSITEGINLAEKSLQSLEKDQDIILDLRHIYYKSSNRESVLVLDTIYEISRYVLVLHRLGGNRLEDYATYVVKDIMTDRDTNQTMYIANITDFGGETILSERENCSKTGVKEMEHTWTGVKEMEHTCKLLESVNFPVQELSF